ncbi:MAG: carboxylating nicotinate-nucleotide diphosphorylase [Betaproteobacteria bacterium]|nr:carboxylating nicotinate-nucleotide diphosphorylase [Betaproteobacteria bacterium]
MSQETLVQARARNIRDALEEDIGPCDWTAQLISPDTLAEATLRVREAAVLCGREWFSGCVTQLDPKASIRWYFQEGAMMPANATVCEIAANARALLTAERPALNFLQLLSATATQTRAFADAIAGVSPNPRGCVVLDTRKTMPGLRQAQKYAVRVGGGANQRLALWDGILIKENHILAAGGIAAALRAARELNAAVSIQIEVESLDELLQALNADAKSILIDNFSLQEMREAVAINQGRALLEASGGISLDSIRAVAATGVDRISVGSITKDVKAIDFSLRVTARQD